MKHRIIALWCGLLTWLVPVAAFAAEEAEKVVDARFQGYGKPVTVEPTSPALSWLALIFLAGACIAVLFKDAKRTHMD